MQVPIVNALYVLIYIIISLKTLKNEEIDRTPRVDPKLLELVLKHTFKVPKINLEYEKLTG